MLTLQTNSHFPQHSGQENRPQPLVEELAYQLYDFVSSIEQHLPPNALPHFMDLLQLHLSTQDSSLVSFDDICRLGLSDEAKGLLADWWSDLKKWVSEDILNRLDVQPEFTGDAVVKCTEELEGDDGMDEAERQEYCGLSTLEAVDEIGSMGMEERLENLAISTERLDVISSESPTLGIHQYLDSSGHVIGSASSVASVTEARPRSRKHSSSLVVLAHLSKLTPHLERVQTFFGLIFQADEANYWFKRYLRALRLDDETATHADIMGNLHCVIADIDKWAGIWLKCFLLEEEVAGMFDISAGTLHRSLFTFFPLENCDHQKVPSPVYMSLLTRLRSLLSQNISTEEIVCQAGAEVNLALPNNSGAFVRVKSCLKEWLEGTKMEDCMNDENEGERGGIFRLLHAPFPVLSSEPFSPTII